MKEREMQDHGVLAVIFSVLAMAFVFEIDDKLMEVSLSPPPPLPPPSLSLPPTHTHTLTHIHTLSLTHSLALSLSLSRSLSSLLPSLRTILTTCFPF